MGGRSKRSRRRQRRRERTGASAGASSPAKDVLGIASASIALVAAVAAGVVGLWNAIHRPPGAEAGTSPTTPDGGRTSWALDPSRPPGSSSAGTSLAPGPVGPRSGGRAKVPEPPGSGPAPRGVPEATADAGPQRPAPTVPPVPPDTVPPAPPDTAPPAPTETAPPAASVTVTPGVGVERIELAAVPSAGPVTCAEPVTVTFRGRIRTIGGAGTVAYRWLREPGVESELHRLFVEGPGTYEVETSRTVPVAAGESAVKGWERIVVVAPSGAAESPEAPFELPCGGAAPAD